MKKKRILGVYKFYLREDIIGVLNGRKEFHTLEHLKDVKGKGSSFCKIPYRLFNYIDDNKKSINAVLLIGYIMSTTNETFNLTNFFNNKLGKRLNTVSSTLKVRKEIASFGAPALKELIEFGKLGNRCIMAKVNIELYEGIYSGIEFKECKELDDETTEELAIYIHPKTKREKAVEFIKLIELTESDFMVANLFLVTEDKIALPKMMLEHLKVNEDTLNNFSLVEGDALVKNENTKDFIFALLKAKNEFNIKSFKNIDELLNVL